MKLKIMPEWLNRKLAEADDGLAGAGGTDLVALKKDAERRIVTPAALAQASSNLGKVVRYSRERKGWTQEDLARIADTDVEEIISIETVVDFVPKARTVHYISNAFGFSQERMREFVGFIQTKSVASNDRQHYAFAARSRSIGSITNDEYDAICALVEVLADKKGQAP